MFGLQAMYPQPDPTDGNPVFLSKSGHFSTSTGASRVRVAVRAVFLYSGRTVRIRNSIDSIGTAIVFFFVALKPGALHWLGAFHTAACRSFGVLLLAFSNEDIGRTCFECCASASHSGIPRA